MKKIIRYLSGLVLTLLMAFAMLISASVQVEAKTNTAMIGSYTIVVPDGVDTPTGSSPTVVDASSTSWSTGWYVVNSNITSNGRITVSGNVNLILCDDAKLTVTGSKGIDVSGSNSLTIWGQAKGTGTLDANYLSAPAGIGSLATATAGNITINGGTVKAESLRGAGIGGGVGQSCKSITINGGKVTAISSSGSALGNGGNSTGTCNITISDNMMVKSGNTELTLSGTDTWASKLNGVRSVTVTPIPVYYTITINDCKNGTVTANYTKAEENNTVTLTVTPDEGCTVSYVRYNGTTLTSSTNQYTFTMPAENVNITASFTDNHSKPIEFAEKAATCTTAGCMAYWYCPNCKKYYSENPATNPSSVISDLSAWKNGAGKISANHTWVYIDKVSATCSKAGHAAYKYCTSCKTYFTDGGAEISDITSWLTGEGLIPATDNHNLQKKSAIDATCAKDGQQAYWRCQDCGKYFADSEGKEEIEDIAWWIVRSGKIDASTAAHTWGDWEANNDATCTEYGTKTRTCTVCGKTETERDDDQQPLRHKNLRTIAEQEATETKDGHRAYYYCPDCKTYFDESSKVIEDINSWLSDANGGLIPATAHVHTPVIDEAVAATCTKSGLTQGSHCSTCGAIITAQTVVKETGHEYTATVVAATRTSQGYTIYKCSQCGYSYRANYTASRTTLIAQVINSGKADQLSWNAIPDAKTYKVYGKACKDKSWTLVKTTSHTSCTVKISGTSIMYEYYVQAFDKTGKLLKTSPKAHITHSAKYTNPVAVTVKKGSVSVKVSKTYKIKATVINADSTMKLHQHNNSVRYISDNSKVAKVSKTGVITAQAAGKCTIYVIAGNGVSTMVDVTVK